RALHVCANVGYERVERGGLFFFQAEDGIRDRTVTGVQTCALPICPPSAPKIIPFSIQLSLSTLRRVRQSIRPYMPIKISQAISRSEERRVGKECRARWSR